MNIASTLSIYRKRAGLSQAQLAEIAGIDTLDIINFEKGFETPSMEKFSKIAVACDVSVDELFSFDRESDGI